MDMPPIRTIILETAPDPGGPFGAKGVGEDPIVAIGPAIANAVYDAIGVRFRHYPIRPEQVLQALREKAAAIDRDAASERDCDMTNPNLPTARPVPVTILTGFLGSGKTTLLNHILTERHGHRIAVIENEFGEIDVDSDLVLTSDEEIFQMTNGCICCVADVRTDLVRILKKLFERSDKFDHILVETSGLADPTPVATAFFVDDEVARQVKLDGVVTLVDAVHIESHLDDPALHGFDNQAVDQIVAADRIIINKIDLADEPQLAALERRIRGINEGAQILRSSHAQVDLGQHPRHRRLRSGRLAGQHRSALPRCRRARLRCPLRRRPGARAQACARRAGRASARPVGRFGLAGLRRTVRPRALRRLARRLPRRSTATTCSA